MNLRAKFQRAATVLFIGSAAAILNAQTQPSPPGGTVPQKPAVTKPATKNGDYPDYDPETVERGHKLFQTNCSFCHGANAKGGESGPDLLRSPIVLHDENGDKIGQVVLNGRPDKGMPKFGFTNEQIVDVSTFLHDRVKGAALRDTYKILNIVSGDPKAGAAYFNGAGGCKSCHSVTGDLAHLGSKYDAVGVQQHIVDPREEQRGRRGAPMVPSATTPTATITLASGETVKGVLDHVDDFTVSVIDANGDHRSFAREGNVPRVEIHDPLRPHIELLKKYTDTDIHNLTAYLITLK